MKGIRSVIILAAAALIVAAATPAFASVAPSDKGQVNGDVTSSAHLSLMITGADLHYGAPHQGDVDVPEINSTRTVFTNTGDVQSGLFIQGDGPAKAMGKDGYWDMTSQAAKDAFVWKFDNGTLNTDVTSAAASDLGTLGFNDSKDFGSTIDMPTFTTKTGTYQWSATAWVTDPS